MSINVGEYNGQVLEELSLYLSYAEDCYIERKPYIITEAHEVIKKTNYETEADYYSDLTDFIISRL